MRVLLADLWDETGQSFHEFTALFTCFAKTEDGQNVVMIEQVFCGNKYVSDHCWVHRSKALKRLEPVKGDTLKFQAVVGKYPKPRDFVDIRKVRWDYGLEHIREIEIIKRGKQYEQLNRRRVPDPPRNGRNRR